MKKKSGDERRETEDHSERPSSVLRRPSYAGSATFTVKVVPRASRSAIDGWHDDVLRVRLQAPPVEGKANAALIALLADALHVGKGNIEIVGGQTARTKRIRVQGLTADQVKMGLDTIG